MENINSNLAFSRVYSAVCQLRYCSATPSFIQAGCLKKNAMEIQQAVVHHKRG
jgi:hypothetical protein